MQKQYLASRRTEKCTVVVLDKTARGPKHININRALIKTKMGSESAKVRFSGRKNFSREECNLNERERERETKKYQSNGLLKAKSEKQSNEYLNLSRQY